MRAHALASLEHRGDSTCIATPIASVRASRGALSTGEDVYALVDWLHCEYVLDVGDMVDGSHGNSDRLPSGKGAALQVVTTL